MRTRQLFCPPPNTHTRPRECGLGGTPSAHTGTVSEVLQRPLAQAKDCQPCYPRGAAPALFFYRDPGQC